MTPRPEEPPPAATTPFRFVQRHLPAAAKAGPLIFTIIAGAGVAVGIGAGLLFAPQSGREFRASLLDKSQGLSNSLGTRVESVVHAVEEEVASKATKAPARRSTTATATRAAKRAARA